MCARAMSALCVLCVLAIPVCGQSIIINHTNFDPSGLSQEVMDNVGQLKIYFAHASVGGNMVAGMNDLRGQNAARYQLLCPSDDDVPPATTVAGNMYQYQRGNPGWLAKVTTFETYMGNGWGTDKVDIAINKFCYIDEAAGFTTYRDSMVTLESTYPNTKFVYMTIPIMTSGGYDGYLRQVFNDQLRQFSAANSKILLDIADIEAWSPAGVEQTYLYNSTTCQLMYSGYTLDGGHLYIDGRQRVAKGMYSLFAAIIDQPLTILGWQVVANHAAQGELATTISDSYVEPRRAGLKKFRLSLSGPVDASTLVPGAVSIVGLASGDRSSQISDMSLDGTGKVLTVTLSQALPNGDLYTVTVSNSVHKTDGTALEGDRDITVRTLAGDVNGSREVDWTDMLEVRVQAGKTVDADSASADIDCSGQLTSADTRAVRPFLGTSVP